MKKAVVGVAAVSAAIAIGWVAYAIRRQEGWGQMYKGTDARLSVTFRYPATWRLQEERGKVDPYSEVRLMGPRNRENTYTCSLIVRGSPLKEH